MRVTACFVESLGRVEVRERSAAGGAGTIEAHAVGGLSADAEAFLKAGSGFAHDGAFAIDQARGGDAGVKRGGAVLHVAFDGLQRSFGAIEAADVGDAILPGSFVEGE